MISRSTLEDIRAGILAILPAALAMYPFALIMGQQAAAKGLTPLEVLSMSSIVFAGSSQFLAISLWSEPAPVLTLVFATFLINLRHMLMGASIGEKIHAFGSWRFPAVHFMTDESWAVAEQRAISRPLTLAFWFGAGIFLFLNWQAMTVLGAVIGSFIEDPSRYGFDFAFPAIFIALALGFWKGWRTAPVIITSGLTTLLVYQLTSGAWYVIAGAIAGISAAVVTEKAFPGEAA